MLGTDEIIEAEARGEPPRLSLATAQPDHHGLEPKGAVETRVWIHPLWPLSGRKPPLAPMITFVSVRQSPMP